MLHTTNTLLYHIKLYILTKYDIHNLFTSCIHIQDLYIKILLDSCSPPPFHSQSQL